jgi:hypothetical protein
MRATMYRAVFILIAKETGPILIYLLGYKVISMYIGLRGWDRIRDTIPTKGKHILINFC